MFLYPWFASLYRTRCLLDGKWQMWNWHLRARCLLSNANVASITANEGRQVSGERSLDGRLRDHVWLDLERFLLNNSEPGPVLVLGYLAHLCSYSRWD